MARNAVKRSLLQLPAEIAPTVAMEAAVEVSMEDAAVAMEAAAAMEPAKTPGLDEVRMLLLLPRSEPPGKPLHSEQ